MSATESPATARQSDIPSESTLVAARDLALLFVGCIVSVFGVRILLSVLTLLPLVSPYFYSFDSVNFALALKDFDPTQNQPQPPGYPFFVGEARLFYHWLGTPELTFFVLETVISGLAVGMLYLLARRMFSSSIAWIAAALLFVNPVFWFSALTSPLRPHLALLSTLVAYLCWRALQGEQRYFYAASAALGLAGGFRPELLPVLLPLWTWTAWHLKDRFRKAAFGAVLIGITTLLWVCVLVVVSGGLHHMTEFFGDYLLTQTRQTSVLLSPRSGTWLRSAGRAVVWNALGVVPWIWAIPFGWRQRQRVREWKRLAVFLALWFLPVFFLHLTIHIDDPDHVLSSVPVLCLLGAFCVDSAGNSALRLWPEFREGKPLVIAAVLGVTLLLFFGQFPLPQRGRAVGFRGWQSVEDAVLIGTYESSYARVRWVNQMMELAMQQIHDLESATNRPVLLLWARDGEPVWRKICYYLPTQKVYVLDESGDPAVPWSRAALVTSNHRLALNQGMPPILVPVPKGGRLIWIIAPIAEDGLKQVVPLQKAAPLYYSDLAPGAPSFRWGSFEFVPQ